MRDVSPLQSDGGGGWKGMLPFSGGKGKHLALIYLRRGGRGGEKSVFPGRRWKNLTITSIPYYQESMVVVEGEVLWYAVGKQRGGENTHIASLYLPGRGEKEGGGRGRGASSFI